MLKSPIISNIFNWKCVVWLIISENVLRMYKNEPSVLIDDRYLALFYIYNEVNLIVVT